MEDAPAAKKPVAQLGQAEAPLAAYFPAAHSEHEELPVAAENVPEVQLAHVDAPAAA